LKILLDHNLDRRLKLHLPAHHTSTTQEQGWADVINGKLLDLVEANGFNVLLTADANIKDQQNISNRSFSILVLRALNNRLSTHTQMLDDAEDALSQIQPGEVIEIFHTDFRKRS
jgi:predicted nuclease of predicted toxin-antitoxin system